jgi:hypothetical protein
VEGAGQGRGHVDGGHDDQEKPADGVKTNIAGTRAAAGNI